MLSFGEWMLSSLVPKPDSTVGVPRPTSLAFGGPGLARLYVTSAWDRLTAEQLEAAPDSGLLLTFQPRVPGQAGPS